MMASININSLCEEFQTSLNTDEVDPYTQAREDTFIGYYKMVKTKLSEEQLFMFSESILADDEQCIRILYKMGILDALYDTNKSITQSLRSQAGSTLEKIVASKLTELNISFGKQVYVKDNIICKKTRDTTGGHTLDFVIPKPTIGDNVSQYYHISSKTTLRERVHQDQHIQCKKNIVVTYDVKTQQASSNGFTCITLVRGKEKSKLDCLRDVLC